MNRRMLTVAATVVPLLTLIAGKSFAATRRRGKRRERQASDELPARPLPAPPSPPALPPMPHYGGYDDPRWERSM